MAGCYGNTKEDRYFEQQLFRHLAELDDGDAQIEANYEAGMASLPTLYTRTSGTSQYSRSYLQELLENISDEKLFLPLGKAILDCDAHLAGELLIGLVQKQVRKEAVEKWEDS